MQRHHSHIRNRYSLLLRRSRIRTLILPQQTCYLFCHEMTEKTTYKDPRVALVYAAQRTPPQNNAAAPPPVAQHALVAAAPPNAPQNSVVGGHPAAHPNSLATGSLPVPRKTDESDIFPFWQLNADDVFQRNPLRDSVAATKATPQQNTVAAAPQKKKHKSNVTAESLKQHLRLISGDAPKTKSSAAAYSSYSEFMLDWEPPTAPPGTVQALPATIDQAAGLPSQTVHAASNSYDDDVVLSGSFASVESLPRESIPAPASTSSSLCFDWDQDHDAMRELSPTPQQAAPRPELNATQLSSASLTSVSWQSMGIHPVLDEKANTDAGPAGHKPEATSVASRVHVPPPGIGANDDLAVRNNDSSPGENIPRGMMGSWTGSMVGYSTPSLKSSSSSSNW